MTLQVYSLGPESLEDESSEPGSPKTASAGVEFGGSFSVRVVHAGGPGADYSVDVDYDCP